jgi:hypothetical protein
VTQLHLQMLLRSEFQVAVAVARKEDAERIRKLQDIEQTLSDTLLQESGGHHPWSSDHFLQWRQNHVDLTAFTSASSQQEELLPSPAPAPAATRLIDGLSSRISDPVYPGRGTIQDWTFWATF